MAVATAALSAATMPPAGLWSELAPDDVVSVSVRGET